MSNKRRLYHGTTLDNLARIQREGRIRGMLTSLKTGGGYGALYWARLRAFEHKKIPVVLRLIVPKSVIKTKTMPCYFVAKTGRMIRASYVNAVWVFEGGIRGWRQYKSIDAARNRRRGRAVSM